MLRQMDDRQLCPVTAFRLLLERSRRLGAGDVLFCSDSGRPYQQTAGISRLLRRLMTAAGIPDHYVAYSIRHALITALFDAGLSETDVNTYTGHSHNAHTAARFYYHLNSRWVGATLLQKTASVPIPARAADLIQADSDAKQKEDMEEHEESETDIPQPSSSSSSSSSSSAHRDFSSLLSTLFTPAETSAVQGKKDDC